MYKFRDVNPTFKTWILPGLCTNIVSTYSKAIRKNSLGRARRYVWEVFTEATMFKDPLCVSCKASVVCLHFILIKESFCYKSKHLKAFFHASQAVVKNVNTETGTDHKNSQNAEFRTFKKPSDTITLYFILHYKLSWGDGCIIIYWGWWRKRL